jgi:hypothetical protein
LAFIALLLLILDLLIIPRPIFFSLPFLSQIPGISSLQNIPPKELAQTEGKVKGQQLAYAYSLSVLASCASGNPYVAFSWSPSAQTAVNVYVSTSSNPSPSNYLWVGTFNQGTNGGTWWAGDSPSPQLGTKYYAVMYVWTAQVSSVGSARTPPSCAPTPTPTPRPSPTPTPVAVDTTPPTVSITSPSANSTVAGTVTIEAQASDTGGSGISVVWFQIDGSNVGSDTTYRYQYSWNTNNYSNGSHGLRAWAQDRAGNWGASSEIYVTVNNAGGPTPTPTPRPGTPTPTPITIQPATNLNESQQCEANPDSRPVTVTFSWTPGAGTRSFYVYVWAPEQGQWLRGALRTTTSDTWYNFPSGTYHTWVVQSMSNSNGTGNYANSAQRTFGPTIPCPAGPIPTPTPRPGTPTPTPRPGTPTPTPTLTPQRPTAPSNLTFVKLTDNGIRLSWKDNSTNETHWFIYHVLPDGSYHQDFCPFSTSSSGHCPYHVLVSNTTTNTGSYITYSEGSLSLGTHKFSVAAFNQNSGLVSTPTPSIQVMITAAPTPTPTPTTGIAPTSPPVLTAPIGRITSTNPRFTWQGVTGANNYWVYLRKYDPNFGSGNFWAKRTNCTSPTCSIDWDRSWLPNGNYRNNPVPQSLTQGQTYYWSAWALYNNLYDWRGFAQPVSFNIAGAVTPTSTPSPTPTPNIIPATLTLPTFSQCTPNGMVPTTFRWTRATGGIADSQWLDLSIYNNGFQPGTYIGISNPPFPNDSSYVTNTNPLLGPLRSGILHYWRLNTHIRGEPQNVWHPSLTGNFTTPPCPTPTPTTTPRPTSTPTPRPGTPTPTPTPRPTPTPTPTLTPTPYPLPTAPTNLRSGNAQCINNEMFNIDLAWDQTGIAPQGYWVEMALSPQDLTSQTGSFRSVQPTPVNNASIRITNIPNLRTHYWRVWAYNQEGRGVYSHTNNFPTFGPPPNCPARTGVEQVFTDASNATGVPRPMIKAIAYIETGGQILLPNGLNIDYTNPYNCVNTCYGPMQVDGGTWDSTVSTYYNELVAALGHEPNKFNNVDGIFVGSFHLKYIAVGNVGAPLYQGWTDEQIRAVAAWYNCGRLCSCGAWIASIGMCYVDGAVYYYHLFE